MDSSKLVTAFALVATVFSQGCATSALWETNHFAEFGEPSPKAKLALSWSDEHKDVVVEYDEIATRKGDVHRRAYWLFANDIAVQDARAPGFLRAIPGGLESITVLDSEPGKDQKPVTGLYAVQFDGGRKFRLHGPARDATQRYDLPVYCVDSGRFTQVLLTPPAVVADATIIGGVLFIWLHPWGEFVIH